MRSLCLVAGVLVAVTGCAGGEKTGDSAAAAVTPTPASSASTQNADRARSAAAVANAIAARPSAADSILTAAGMTRDSFQTLMYEIAADSAMSAAYAAAKTR